MMNKKLVLAWRAGTNGGEKLSTFYETLLTLGGLAKKGPRLQRRQFPAATLSLGPDCWALNTSEPGKCSEGQELQ